MSEENDNKVHRHPIKVVAKRAGITLDVLRAWERRYGAVSPSRTSTNRRLYSDADVERLTLLRRATLAGHSIGQVAQLTKAALLELVSSEQESTPTTRPVTDTTTDSSSAQYHLEVCIRTVERLDAWSLEGALSRASLDLSRFSLLEQVLIPLFQKIGDLWSEGSLRVVHEHFASAAVRTFLGTLRDASTNTDWAPSLVVTTPAGQRHAFGALVAAATAASEGWRVTYLGPDLPAEEIAAGVEKLKARALALSIVYPCDDPKMGDELRRLKRLLSEDVAILVGGRATEGYKEALTQIHAHMLPAMQAFRRQLETLRA
jgi:DNA-binding transcriptional MerR regulator/methylmalonyl-CoA mutase cobalamin-binding subunit